MSCPDLPPSTAFAAETRAFRGHAAGCAACAARLAELERVERALGEALGSRDVAPPCPPPEALLDAPSPRVAAHLVECADCRHALRAARAVAVGVGSACVSWGPALLYPQDDAGHELLREAEAHAWSCAACDEAYTALRFSEQRLAEAVLDADPASSPCPEPGELLDWVGGPLTTAQAEHLIGCADCRADLRLAQSLGGSAPAPRPPAPASPARRPPWIGGALLGGALLVAAGATSLLLGNGRTAPPSSGADPHLDAPSADPRPAGAPRGDAAAPAGQGAERGREGADGAAPGAGPADPEALPLPGDLTRRSPDDLTPLRPALDGPERRDGLAASNPLEGGLLRGERPSLADDDRGALTGEVPARDPRATPDATPPLVRLEVLAASGVEVLLPDERVWTALAPGGLASGSRLRTHDAPAALEVAGARLSLAPQSRLTLTEELVLKTGQVYVDGQLALSHALCRVEFAGQGLLEGVPGEVAVALVAGVAVCTDDRGVSVQLRPSEVVRVSATSGLRAPEGFPPEAGTPAPPSWAEEAQAALPPPGPTPPSTPLDEDDDDRRMGGHDDDDDDRRRRDDDDDDDDDRRRRGEDDDDDARRRMDDDDDDRRRRGEDDDDDDDDDEREDD
ncbi:MAG: hypothetical protein R3F62_20970 [Planctomycetota bacterium]